MKRSEKIKADAFLNRLWTEAVDKPGYNKEEWKRLQRAIWEDTDREAYFIDVRNMSARELEKALNKLQEDLKKKKKLIDDAVRSAS